MTDEAPSAATATTTTPANPDAGANNKKGRKRKGRKKSETCHGGNKGLGELVRHLPNAQRRGVG